MPKNPQKPRNDAIRKIFRAYDIRGIAHEELSSSLVHDIGVAFGSLLLEQNEHSLVVGRDGRLSSPSLMEAFQAGLLSTGCEVTDLGIIPTPLLYFATKMLGIASGAMLTGSHNPSNYNGIKMVIKDAPASALQIQSLYERLGNEKPLCKKGVLKQHQIAQQYIDYIAQRVRLPRKIKVVLDAGNAVAGAIAPQLFSAIGCEVIPLFCELDGNFPNHHPDPTQLKNLKDLIQTVQLHQADIGLGFDGDGDRLGVVGNKGTVLWADRLLMLFAKDILAKHPKGKVIFDVKCSKNVDKVVRASGGIPIMTKTGHSFMKETLKKENALLAGELSGHLCFNDDWFGFDDGLYAGVRMVKLLSEQTLDAQALFNTVPDSVATPEYQIPIDDDRKFPYMAILQKNAHFPDAKIIDIDGLRIEFPQGWGLVRASNTTPTLVLRFEADTEQNLFDIQQVIKHFLLKFDPTLSFPF